MSSLLQRWLPDVLVQVTMTALFLISMPDMPFVVFLMIQVIIRFMWVIFNAALDDVRPS